MVRKYQKAKHDMEFLTQIKTISWSLSRNYIAHFTYKTVCRSRLCLSSVTFLKSAFRLQWFQKTYICIKRQSKEHSAILYILKGKKTQSNNVLLLFNCVAHNYENWEDEWLGQCALKSLSKLSKVTPP